MKKYSAIYSSYGTTSGGSSEDDRSEKSGSSGVGGSSPSQETTAQQDYPYRISVIDINKDESPLFRNFEGEVKVILPYKGEDIPEMGLGKELTSIRVHLSEVTFLYGGPNNSADNPLVIPVTDLNRTHVFLAESALLKTGSNSAGSSTLPVLDDTKHEHLIHDFRPLNRVTRRSIEVGSEQEFISEAEPGAHALYLIITRAESSRLTETNNLYTIGIADFSKQDPPMPQLYQKVQVKVDLGKELYPANKGLTAPPNLIEIREHNSDEPRALLRVAASILIPTEENNPEFTAE